MSWTASLAVGRLLTSGRSLLSLVNLLEVFMRPLNRGHVDKRGSARNFRSNTHRTKSPNMSPPPMRGGFRL